MHTNDFKAGLISLSLTLILLLVTDIVFSSLLPVIGLNDLRFSIHVLIILYLGLRVESPYLALFIFLVEYFHSLFTIEGWAMGTFTGVLICITIGFVKDIIHLRTKFMIFLIVQLFQLAWFLVIGFLIYLKLDNFNYVLTKFFNFIPTSIIISIIAPWIFPLLDRIWVSSGDHLIEDHV